jgi:hypothetical protein
MNYRLIGHAIVSANDRIADADGRMPPELHNERDWALFQSALDRAAITLIGRASHEATPNTKRRRRLIISRESGGLEERADGFWLNPAKLLLRTALEQLVPEDGVIAVVGGQAVFELVGAAGFSAFHLARVRGLVLPGGRGLFRACEEGVPAAKILSAGGLIAGREEMLDRDADVTLTIWSRAS